MARRRNSLSDPYVNPNWDINYEYLHGKDLILPGMFIKIKHERGHFKFQRVVLHKEKNVQWVDCYNQNGYRAFYIDQLKGLVKVKKKRIKKDV